uniref:Uncharacterized protein n=1 Tax=Arundo donax TaxID=35708 RepID=A0A0A9HMR5_ARUDO
MLISELDLTFFITNHYTLFC